MVLEQPPIEIFGVTIYEPVTSATDLLVAAMCFYGWYQLKKLNRKEQSQRFMNYYLFTLGWATAIAAFTAHAFLPQLRPYFGEYTKLIGWIMSMVSVSWLERGAIAHATPLMGAKPANWIKWANYVELFILIGGIIVTINFVFVEIHSILGLLLVAAPLHVLAWRRKRDKGSLYILWAIGMAAVAMSFFVSKIGISKWFNHSDIAHVFLTISAYLTYLGARNMKVYERAEELKA